MTGCITFKVARAGPLMGQRYEEHRRSNRRVKVVSTLVGNHTYAVTSGCTWATLAQRNPKALALDSL